jgi:hypothetical protein
MEQICHCIHVNASLFVLLSSTVLKSFQSFKVPTIKKYCSLLLFQMLANVLAFDSDLASLLIRMLLRYNLLHWELK